MKGYFKCSFTHNATFEDQAFYVHSLEQKSYQIQRVNREGTWEGEKAGGESAAVPIACSVLGAFLALC